MHKPSCSLSVIDTPHFQTYKKRLESGANGAAPLIIGRDLYGISVGEESAVSVLQVKAANLNEPILISSSAPWRGLLQAPVEVTFAENYRSVTDVPATEDWYFTVDAWEIPPRTFRPRAPYKVFDNMLNVTYYPTRDIMSIGLLGIGDAGTLYIYGQHNDGSAAVVELITIDGLSDGYWKRIEDFPFNKISFSADDMGGPPDFVLEGKDRF